MLQQVHEFVRLRIFQDKVIYFQKKKKPQTNNLLFMKASSPCDKFQRILEHRDNFSYVSSSSTAGQQVTAFGLSHLPIESQLPRTCQFAQRCPLKCSPSHQIPLLMPASAWGWKQSWVHTLSMAAPQAQNTTKGA